jgi:hypothetical protein
MVRSLILGIATLSFGLTAAAPATAAPCRGAHGKFVKCPDKAKPVRCRDAKGRFAKCGTAGAKPAK